MAKQELIVEGFSYADLDKDDAAKLQYWAREIQKSKAAYVSAALAIGQTLIAANAQLAKTKTRRGTFQKWVELECGFSLRAAYNYMAAFRVFGVCATIAQIEDSAMYALADKKTPEEALKEAIKLSENGVKITHKKAKELVKKYKVPVRAKPEEKEEEEEPEVEEEPTIEEICEEANKAIESFCRAIVKQFEKDVPRLPWTEDSGRIASALDSLKAGLTTLRGAKSIVCPACVEGRTENGKCKYCKGHGYLPVFRANQIPADQRS